MISAKRVLNSLTIFIMAMVISCSRAPVTQDFTDTASATQELKNLQSDIQMARTDQVNVLAPTNFAKAEEYLKDAQKSIDKEKSEKKSLHLIAQSRAYLTQATGFAKISHTNLEEVIIARQQAVDVKAPTYFDKAFRKTDAKLVDITEDIEKNDINSALKNRNVLQAEYMGLELQAIKRINLGPAQAKIDQAKKEGAPKFAPRSLAMANKSLQDFDAYITANRHESVEIARRAQETQTSADHLLKITMDSKAGNKVSSEDMALKMEDEQDKVADKQSELNKKSKQLDSKDKQLLKGQMANQALTAENDNLTSDQAFNQRFEEARSEFTKTEAEVYKQGNTLTIRLKSLEFPSSKSELKGTSFPLLSKVQKVINSFDHKTVVIEGHTDSIGGKSVNEKLSSERAEAVKQYFVSNNHGEAINIESVGYDYQKPLASNKTVSGRATNRRVDVLITVQQ